MSKFILSKQPQYASEVSMIKDLIGRHLNTVRMQDVMLHLSQICRFDRYQASLGIEHAAIYVAEAANQAGLADVKIEYFPADGETRWWTYRAPLSWTPVRARLTIVVDGVSSLCIDHADLPYSVASYSVLRGGYAEAPLLNWCGGIVPKDIEGAVVVLNRETFEREGVIFQLTEAGALGFITNAAARSGEGKEEYTGRIELDQNTQLFGFSVTSARFDYIRTVASYGAYAHVELIVDREARMPVVTGILPGIKRDREIWLTAHLCHPRPGANDNGSGVASLLGVAAALAKQYSPECFSEHTIRFVWGPEFVGTVALLYQMLNKTEPLSLPFAVINLDMVGEDQGKCGGPFIVERNPDSLPSPIGAIAESVVHEVFLATGNSGTWVASPFLGFSDHALFADPRIASPAIQFCHAPDRFNHSSGDSPDKVSELEMLRSIVAAGVLADLLVNNSLPANTTRDYIVQEWCRNQLQAALNQSDENNEWRLRRLRYIERRNACLLNRNLGMSTSVSELLMADDPSWGGLAMHGCWEGPFNLRALIEDLPKREGEKIAAMIRAKKMNYAYLTNFAIRADGRRSRSTIIAETSYALGQPINRYDAEVLVDALVSSGWITE